MSNINWGQFLNNFSNNFNRVSQTHVQNLQQPQNAQANEVQPAYYVADLSLPKTTAQLNQTMAQLANLNQQQTVNLLKDLMNFPKNFEQLLTQLTTNSTAVNKEAFLLLFALRIGFHVIKSIFATLCNNSIQRHLF